MKIIVEKESIKQQLEETENRNVLQFLQKHSFTVHAPCGGRGHCGKCLVEIDGKMQLACRCLLHDGMIIRIAQESAETEVQRRPLAVAMDLGTTMISTVLYDAVTAEKIAVRNFANPQETFGADVITRIQAVQKDPENLQRMSRILLDRLIRECAPYGTVKKLLISGNTIMELIVSGHDPVSTANYPFTAETLFRAGTETLPSHPEMEVSLMPCISSYVGGDIVSGLYACDLKNTNGNVLFLDVGTNGEMVLKNKQGMYACSVPAGPAFEGGEISCGSSDPGHAISHFTFADQLEYTCPCDLPEGVLGSGIIDLLACLLDKEIVEETGRLIDAEEAEEEYRKYLREDEDGNTEFCITEDLAFTFKDVRMLQMAIASLSAGISTLLIESNTPAEAIDTVYLSGSFGYHLNIASCIRTGMFPAVWKDRITLCGNTSLKGAEMVLNHPEVLTDCRQLASECSYIELSDSSTFKEQYVEYMLLTEDKQWNSTSR